MAFLDDLYIVTLPDRWGPCTRLFRKNSESMLAYASIAGRRRSGTGQEPDQQHVMPLRGRPGSSIHGPQCGRGQVYQPVSKASKSLGLRWATMILWLPIWSQSWQNTSASARACYQIRVVRPSAAAQFAETRNGTLWQCLSNILQIDLNQCDEVVRDVATLPLSMGGLGLRSAVRVRSPAYWASWADCLSMTQARHPLVVEEARRAAWDLYGGTLW